MARALPQLHRRQHLVPLLMVMVMLLLLLQRRRPAVPAAPVAA
jgi:hypothetical protein